MEVNEGFEVWCIEVEHVVEMELVVMDSEDWMKMHVDIVLEGSCSSNSGCMVVEIPGVFVDLGNLPLHLHSLDHQQSKGIDP